MTRALGVDPGEVRIGLAISDPTRTIARPLLVLRHKSRAEDVQRILEIARQEQAVTIVVGVAYGVEANGGRSARRGRRMADALKTAGFAHVEQWDESGSTASAAAIRQAGEMVDARAAAFILQGFLDAHRPT